VTGATAASVARLRRRCMRRAPRWHFPGRVATCWTASRQLGERVHICRCNLSDSAEVEALVPAGEAAMGQVDILVANAGITRDNLFVQLARRGLGRRHQGQSDRDLSLPAPRLIDDAQALWPNHLRSPSIVGVTGNPGQANYNRLESRLIGLSRRWAPNTPSAT